MKVGSSAIACSLEAAEAVDDDVYVTEERERCESGPWLFVPPLPSNIAASDTGGRFETLLKDAGACCALAPSKREEGATCSSNCFEAAAVAAAAAWLERAAGRRAAAAAAAAS
jgi:hypothetical protein